MAKIWVGLGIFWTWLTALRIGIPGLWLILLYLVFGSFVVLSLSAFQLQQEIVAFRTTEGSRLAIWEVLTRHADWSAAKKDVDTVAAKIGSLSADVVKKNSDIVESRRDLFLQESDCKRKITFIREQYNLKIPDHDTASKFKAIYCHDHYFDEMLSFVASLEGDQKNSFKVEVEAAREAIRTFDGMRFDLELITEAASSAQKDLVAARSELEDKKKIALKAAGSESDPAILDFLSSISYLQKSEASSSIDSFVPNFSEMPPDMLTLILVLSMGALGGTLSLTQIYFASRGVGSVASKDVTASYYLFRPFLGAITALSVFILSKAGVLVVTTSGASGENASLSPFFLSFLGLISGLLAEQALTTIQGVGSRIFTAADSEKLRWAYRLKEELGLSAVDFETMTPEDKQKVAELAGALGVEEQAVLDWLSEKEQVSLSNQRLISVFLRKPPRAIFSDISADR